MRFLNLHERHCVLVLHEMTITPEKIFDIPLHKYFGEVTLSQVVAYHFTGDSVNGAVFKK